MKTLVATSCWGKDRTEMLNRSLSIWSGLPGVVDIVVFADVDFKRELISDTDKSHISVVTGEPDNWKLTWGHRSLFAAKAHAYDLFMYAEYDIAVSLDATLRFIQESQNLPTTYVAGFVRYEIANDTGEKLFPDMSINHPSVRDVGVVVNNRKYFIPNNLHSACCMLTKQHLHIAIDSGHYFDEVRYGVYGLPESACTSPYVSCGLQKVVPFDFEDMLVHHMTDKFVNLNVHDAYLNVKALKAVLSRGR